jgi:hypothetical protein
MESIFKNYELEREDLLARIAESLQLNKTRLERMDSAYQAVAGIIEKDEVFFKKYEVEVYPQGSRRISTTVKPLKDGEFDLDIVLQVFQPHTSFTPDRIFNELLRVLQADSTYKDKLIEKNRCVRIDYEGDFHMDILPASLASGNDEEIIIFHDRKVNSLFKGNPKGFADWFLYKAHSLTTSVLQRFRDAMIESKVETEPLSEDVYAKTPLQRGVQLTKRYRDIYFENRDYPVSSIVITTIFGQFYKSEDSIYGTIDNVLQRIKDEYSNSLNRGTKFKIFNPVIPEEEFTDSWTNKHYESFFNFITDYYVLWQELKKSFEYSNSYYQELFGPQVYRRSLIEKEKTFANTSGDEITKALGLILTGKAHSDSRGKINNIRGEKHEKHSNFGS